MREQIRYMITDSCCYHPKARKDGRSSHWIEVVQLNGKNAGTVKYLKNGTTIRVIREKK